MKEIQAVVFDLDRTLYDRFSTLRSVAFLMKRDRPKWFRQEVSAYRLGEELAEADYWLIYYGWQAVYERLQSRGIFQEPPGDRAFQDYILNTGFLQTAVPFPDTETLLQCLRQRGYRLGLITNGPGFRQRKKLELLGLSRSFDEILISGEFGVQKPDPSIFLEMARRMKLAPPSMAFVGDSLETDIAGANSVGMVSVWVQTSPWRIAGEEYRPAYRINDIFELPQLLWGNGEEDGADGSN